MNISIYAHMHTCPALPPTYYIHRYKIYAYMDIYAYLNKHINEHIHR